MKIDEKYNLRKIDGFFHEKIIVLPQQILTTMGEHPLSGRLYLTDIGYFPHAQNHYRERPDGCQHHIFLFCIDGKGSVNIDGKISILEKNQLLIIPKSTAHIYQSDNDNPWSIYWLHFYGTLSDDLVDWVMKKIPKITIDSAKHSQLIKQFNQIFSLLESGYSIDNMIHISGLLHVFFTSIHQQFTESQKATDFKKNPVTQCIEFMLDQISQTLSLEDLMALTHLSKSYLINLFKEQTGFSPIDYFIHLKIQKACRLLDTSDASIKAISEAIGYHDSYYFSRIFKKIMNATPSQYRRISKG